MRITGKCAFFSFFLGVLCLNTPIWAQQHVFEEKEREVNEKKEDSYHPYAISTIQASFLSEMSMNQIAESNSTPINFIELRTLRLVYMRLSPFKGLISTGYLVGIKAQFIPNGNFENVNLTGGSIAGIVRWNTKIKAKGYGFIQFRSGLNYNIENRIDQLMNSYEFQWEVGAQTGWIVQSSKGRGISVEFGPNWNLSRNGHLRSYELSIGLLLGRKK